VTTKHITVESKFFGNFIFSRN